MLDIVGLLQTEKNEFTRSERALTEIVLADVDSVLKMSIVDLAAQADVSPPTVTRFCRRLGCDSYADFKVRLAQSRFVGQRYFAPAAGPSSVREIAQGVVNGIQSTIYETFDHLDFDAVERAAESIVKAGFVLAFGSGGSSSMVATETEVRLFRLGLKIASSTDHQVQMMRAASSPSGTVILAFSLSGNNLPLVRAMSVAGEYGHTRIVITRSHSSMAEQADILLPIDRRDNPDILRPTPGRYALLAAVDILAQTVATRLGSPAIASMRRIKHQLVVNRDGDDAQPLGD
ncbi:MurR/RpiR family transcriptional regulator [Devosia ginsengisoli]|uniref:MurR/RpiR family transcriptional regulator n=1 Tax=Devosia ginsengisoli TaxID=400770 RepID=A0A5B8LYZ6_9HYPH|nr:MurR/RpiR family transcriptional regulator [Devosia ginsengisoli]QDZ12924.1 MurR/RpiR family transcriptional regulator [Devosia ginsengisoli]